MKRSLILLVVIVAAVLIKSNDLPPYQQASQQQTIDQLKKEIKTLKKTIDETKFIVGK
jgi:septal ring factor EnvC (AmiA/AmiB activator)